MLLGDNHAPQPKVLPIFIHLYTHVVLLTATKFCILGKMHVFFTVNHDLIT